MLGAASCLSCFFEISLGATVFSTSIPSAFSSGASDRFSSVRSFPCFSISSTRITNLLENFDKAKEEGLIDKIEKAGGLILRETCPEVVHYNHDKVKHILTNSMKAEHYLKSGLNAIDTSVARNLNSLI